MLQAEQVRRTRKALPEDLKVGDVIVGHQDDRGKFDTVLYTIQQIHEVRPEDETITVECRYDFDGKAEPSQTRTFGLSKFDCVVVL